MLWESLGNGFPVEEFTTDSLITTDHLVIMIIWYLRKEKLLYEHSFNYAANLPHELNFSKFKFKLII